MKQDVKNLLTDLTEMSIMIDAQRNRMIAPLNRAYAKEDFHIDDIRMQENLLFKV